MRLLSTHESEAWIQDHGLPSLRLLAAGEGQWPSAAFSLDKDSGRKTALSRAIVNSLSNTGPWLFNVVEKDVWPSSANLYLFDRVRSPSKPAPSLDDAPGHLLETHERDLCEALFALGLYFVWGVVLADAESRLIIEADDDEAIRFYSDDAHVLAHMTELATHLGLHPF